jgi:phosphate-selective porin OprO/OprP
MYARPYRARTKMRASHPPMRTPGRRDENRLDRMRYHNEMAKCSRLVIFLMVAAWLSVGLPVQAQDVPQIPVPLPSPTPTPIPAPVPPEDLPEQTQEPKETEKPEDAGETQPEADETPKSEQVTNPGDLAFTDYSAFNLDDIEAEPAKTKWGKFVNGLRGITRYNMFDGDLKFRLGARAQVDGTVGKGNDKYEQFYLPIDNGVRVRRFEVFAVGRVKKFNFNLSFEFGPDWGVNDAWIEGAEGGLEVWGKYLGKLRVGYLNEPFSLQRQTSSYNLGFLERSLPVQTIVPGANIGAMVHDSGPNGRFSWAFGVFTVGRKSDANASNSSLSLTGRTTYRLWKRNEGRGLLQVGVSLSSRSPRGGDTQYRSRPEARFVDYLVDTGPIDASQVKLVGLEVAGVHGPLWLAAEHIRSKVSAQLVGNPTFKGSYVQVGWYLTGGSKLQRPNSGTFDRQRPLIKYGGGNPFKKKNGGSWEVTGRLSRIDLTDGLVEGGELTDISAALNWYPNATARVQLNYIYASPKNQGAANIFLLRVQYQPW